MDILRSLPIGLYLEQPLTWLHYLDPRIKMAWLLSFLAAPILASNAWRLAMVAGLILLTIAVRVPLRVWRQQMGWLMILALFVLVVTSAAPDGIRASHQPRREGLVSTTSASGQETESPLFFNLLRPPGELPQPTDYHYKLVDIGPLHVTRRSLQLGLRVSTLLFTLIYATTLFLLTTAPEEITNGLESLMRPLRSFGLPVTEISLALTLSLRFVPLVLEEVQNLFRAVRTRAINWKKLGVRRALNLWLTVAERLLENLLLRAEQIASAMQVRGFTSPNEHRVIWSRLQLRLWDWLALAVLGGFWALRIGFGGVS
ncbi:energy-coupling factor transporter transmembrane protein EcfT [Leptolyngbya sp. FACHB-261]|uniref:energy-coupling factor transporter transmembrane component T family protein n=1 Tax=Leptolyngbya sp. FACHB-261 TaxID=2692806 RepID=UPI0016873866|nr:CbiQ family ECF transporter T component [Leptolyngbya sp. FACHB-261]MBD2103230.1 hypothetical protein [Leptolyngbya sp. FACHB-261]